MEAAFTHVKQDSGGATIWEASSGHLLYMRLQTPPGWSYALIPDTEGIPVIISRVGVGPLAAVGSAGTARTINIHIHDSGLGRCR